MGLKPLRSNFFIYLEPRNKSKKQRKIKNIGFFGEKSAIFPDFLPIFLFRFSFVKIVSMPHENRFFADKSVEKSDFLFIGLKSLNLIS